jgi:cytochrome d ubiquinol oxidase subunit II
VRAERYEPARASAALAVAAIVAGWGLAQRPELLPGLTIEEAAAGHATLVALLVSIPAGLVVLVPSLVLLYGLVLRGGFDLARATVEEQPQPRADGAPRPLAAVALLVVGVPLTVFGEGALLALGVLALAGFVVVGALELLRPQAFRAEGPEGR